MTKIFGITGKKGSGKDTAGQALVWHGYQNVKFAAPLKEMLRVYLAYVGVDTDTIERMIDGDQKENLKKCLAFRSARYAMQTLGSEWGRQLMDQAFWVNAFKLRAAQFNLVVCTDVRFLNEADAIHELGGKLIRIDRPDLISTDAHASEAEIDLLPADIVIRNDGSMQKLRTEILQYV